MDQIFPETHLVVVVVVVVRYWLSSPFWKQARAEKRSNPLNELNVRSVCGRPYGTPNSPYEGV